MIAPIAIFFYAMVITTSWAGTGNFVYDDHGKKDPCTPLVSSEGLWLEDQKEMGVTDLKLEGVISDASGINVAIMNGKIIQAGDQIGPYTVKTVDEDRVTIMKEDKEFVLNVKKGE